MNGGQHNNVLFKWIPNVTRMSMDDFCRFYSDLDICCLCPEFLDDTSLCHWKTAFYDGRWVAGMTAGGCMNNVGTSRRIGAKRSPQKFYVDWSVPFWKYRDCHWEKNMKRKHAHCSQHECSTSIHHFCQFISLVQRIIIGFKPSSLVS